jgi:uncharacterized protein YkwD
VRSARAAAAIAAIVVMSAASAASACSRVALGGTGAVINPGKGINAALIDAAILSELNYHRCEAGRSALEPNSGLRGIAATHADWMADTGTVSHDSRVAGQSTLRARMSTSGVKFRSGSENIGMVHRYQVEGAPFKIRNASACQFTRSGGKAIAAHSYGSLAREMVDLWMASSHHRHNILDPKVSMVGSAVAFNGSMPHCGQYFLSQNFAG